MEKTVLQKILKFFSDYQPIKYRRGEIIQRFDDEDIPFIFYVDKGYVRQFFYSGRGDEITFNIFTPQAFFPVIYAMNHMPNRYTYETMTDTVLRPAPKDKVLDLLHNNNDILYDLASRLGKGLDMMVTMSEHLKSYNADRKVYSFLLMAAHKYGEKKSDDSYTLKIPFSHREIASIVGLSSETVSQHLEKLKDQGIVLKRNGYLNIKDLRGIEDKIPQ